MSDSATNARLHEIAVDLEQAAMIIGLQTAILRPPKEEEAVAVGFAKQLRAHAAFLRAEVPA